MFHSSAVTCSDSDFVHSEALLVGLSFSPKNPSLGKSGHVHV